VHGGAPFAGAVRTQSLKEARTIAALPDFKGYIHDLSGPPANMYGFECKKKIGKKGVAKINVASTQKSVSALRQTTASKSSF
jgi:hypothetical protein